MKKAEIVFDHPHFIVVDKPAGCLTVPSRYEAEDQRRVLGREIERLIQSRLFPVHRLDYEVSGLVVFAKSSEAHKKLNQLFESRQVQKVYEAWTVEQDFSHWPQDVPHANEFVPLDPEATYTWKCKILRGKRRSYESPQGQNSETQVRFMGKNEKGYLMWRVQPLTGRPHQIRFEMSRHGFPILGDVLYGSKVPWRNQEIALRAIELKIEKLFPDMLELYKVEGLST